jgi:hypothetical protein
VLALTEQVRASEEIVCTCNTGKCRECGVASTVPV